MANRIASGTLAAIFIFLAGAVLNASAEDTPITDMSHPRDAALIQQADGGFSYRKFPEGSHLYIFEGDSLGQSNCTDGCASSWPPLFVSPGAESVGAWTMILRDDGKPQWAYKGQPVYRRFHDLQPDANQLKKAGFRLLEP